MRFDRTLSERETKPLSCHVRRAVRARASHKPATSAHDNAARLPIVRTMRAPPPSPAALFHPPLGHAIGGRARADRARNLNKNQKDRLTEFNKLKSQRAGLIARRTAAEEGFSSGDRGLDVATKNILALGIRPIKRYRKFPTTVALARSSTSELPT
ncbi:hypothetical protein EVAR_59709_1 [Eumeta japonica]|uniref:Uncharacterized protein n=1 Tax=Eumeta variegata TaxID=151549 RepID=A0A4C1XJ51_EUMVA|nr:hypothetical protein EVAR_59709_1 [Eumeta japonica]